MFISPIIPIESISNKETVTAKVENSASVPFSSILKDSITNLEQAQAASNQDALDLALGEADDLHNVMINSAALNTAVVASVQLTSRAVASYKEIMQMQI